MGKYILALVTVICSYLTNLNTVNCSILFNVFLPSGDVYSDLSLMVNALNFNLGDSLLLSGYRACFGKNEQEVYNVVNGSCQHCLKNEYFTCGAYPPMLDKIHEVQNTKTCTSEKWRFTNKNEFKRGDCNNTDGCCLENNNSSRLNNPVSIIDRNVLVSCFSRGSKADYELCYLAGNTNDNFCYRLGKLDTFNEQFRNLVNTDVTNGGNQSLKGRVFKIKELTMDEVILEKGYEFVDGCGIYFAPKEENQPKKGKSCGDDACLVHLQQLHVRTTMHDLKTWRTNTDFAQGIKVGGKTCGLIRLYAWTILIPIILNMGFNLVIFRNDLKNGKANYFEVIPLLLLFYPQWKTLKFLANYAFNHRDETRLNNDKNEHDKDIGSLEPFLEASIQVSKILF